MGERVRAGRRLYREDRGRPPCGGANLKILIAASEYHRIGGFPRYAAQLATALVARGHHVTVAARSWEITDRDAGVEFVRYRTLPWPSLAVMASEPFALTRLFRRLSHRYGACICIGMPALAPMVLLGPGTHKAWYRTTTRSLGSPVRRLFERVRPFHWVVLLWERAMLKGLHPRLVIVPTERGVQDYLDNYGFPRERLSVVRIGVESEEFRFSEEVRARTRQSLGIAGDTVVMLHIGNRGRQKGLDVLAAALDRLAVPEAWEFLFAGGGSTAPELTDATKGLRRSGRVRQLGRVDDTRALYCAADLLVFPSRFDPWGLVVTEALACGLPVLCSAHIGAATAVVEGENGRLVSDPTDAGEMTSKIAQMVSELGRYRREAVSASVVAFSHHAVAADLEAELKRLGGSN